MSFLIHGFIKLQAMTLYDKSDKKNLSAQYEDLCMDKTGSQASIVFLNLEVPGPTKYEVRIPLCSDSLAETLYFKRQFSLV